MEHPWVMMQFVDKLDQFGSYRLLYTSACEVVEEDAPDRHQLCCVCSDRTPGDKVMARHCCSTSTKPSLVPRPSRGGGEGAWYTLQAHSLGSP